MDKVIGRTPGLVAAVGAVMLTWAAPLAAQEPAGLPEKASGREHVVRKGDTLWDLAKLYLTNPFLWPLLYEANRGTVEDPNLIYPNERLVIPPVPAVADAAEAPGAAATEAARGALATKASDGGSRELRRTRFYPGNDLKSERDRDPMFIGEELERKAPVKAAEFYAAPWLAQPNSLRVVGELVQEAGRTQPDRLVQTVHPFDKVYVRYVGGARPKVGDRLLMVQAGRSFGAAGRVIEPAAIITVQELADEVLIGEVSRQFGRLMPGALALPLEEFPGVEPTEARPIENGPVATLLGFVEEQPAYDLSDKGFIDLGREDGIAIGDELVAFLPQRRAKGGYDEKLPPLTVARLRVIRVAERTATVKILGVEYESLAAGLPVQVVAKMP